MYAEAISDEMSEFLSQTSLGKDSVVLEQPPLLEKDRARTISGAYMFGAGEEHVAVMARWFRAKGPNVLAITSDKRAKKMLNRHKISSVGIFGLLLKLNHSGLLPKEQAMTAIKRLEQSRNKMKREEKENLVRQLK